MTEQRYTHADTLELLRKCPISQKQAIRWMMQEFDARLEEMQSLCGESLSVQTEARFETIRTIIGYEIGDRAEDNQQ